MNKLTLLIIMNVMISTTAIASTLSSNVNLSGGGIVSPATQMNIPLTGLVPSATYSVICYLTTTVPFIIVKLGSSFSENTSTVSSYSLNGNVVTQGELSPGENTAVIVGNFASPSTGYITLTNLDQNDSFTVNSCFGTAVLG